MFEPPRIVRVRIPGAQGPKGDTSTITIGTVSTVGSTESATVTNVGTDTDAIFDFEIPQGTTGEQGIQGEQGEQGDPGAYQPEGTPSAGNLVIFGTDPETQLADSGKAPSDYYTKTEADSAFQPKDSDLTSWAGVTRASGFDTFAATPSSANLRSLLTDEVGTGAAYFVGGALGTPASGTLSNCDAFTGDSGSGGTKGVVPAPASGDAAASKFLKADGTWAAPAGSGTIGGSTGSTDNRIIRADGTGGSTIQDSAVAINDSGDISGIAGLAASGTAVFSGTARFTGTVTQSAQTLDRIDIGVEAGTPRMVFEDSGSTIWVVDNASGIFRWFTPGVERLNLSTSTLYPGANDGLGLGDATHSFSDLFLAEGGVINWDNGDATITQTGNDITVAGITSFGVGTSTAFTTGSIELGHASDTTLSRSSAGVVAVEGYPLLRHALSAESATTSGSTVTISSIPAGTKQIILMGEGVSSNNTGAFQIQIGDSGGLEATGYVGAVTNQSGGTVNSFSTGFDVAVSVVAANTYTIYATLTLKDAANNTWFCEGHLTNASNMNTSLGVKSLSDTLDRIALVTPNTWDAGDFSIQYRF